MLSTTAQQCSPSLSYSSTVSAIRGARVGGIWRKVPGTWATQIGLTPQGYQSAFDSYTSQGYRLYRIQGYADSSRFAVIWTK